MTVCVFFVSIICDNGEMKCAGAVMFGIDPTVVGVRRSRLTYGVGVLHRFVPGKHPPSKKITRENSAWCKDVFDRFVAVDQEVSQRSELLLLFGGGLQWRI